MVGGWDKHPGPDNDYAPKPWTTAKWVVFFLSAFVAIVGLAYLNWP